MKVTPGTRHRQRVDRSHLWKKGPIKQLCEGILSTHAGRNNQGRITVYNRSGVRRLYRSIDFQHESLGDVTFAEVKRLEYDPNRTAFIALIEPISKASIMSEANVTSQDTAVVGHIAQASNTQNTSQVITRNTKLGTKINLTSQAYMLAEASTKVGDIVRLLRGNPTQLPSSINADNSSDVLHDTTLASSSSMNKSWTYYLHDIPVGREIYNINGKYIRAAGLSGKITKKSDSEVLVRMPSGSVMSFPLYNGKSSQFASIGSLSNAEHKNEVIGKAGTNRHKGRRPHVRGVAMNPIDHPHGGGGRPGRSVTPWGKPTK